MRSRAKNMTVNIKNVWKTKNLIAFVFLMPWILGFLIFQAVPFVTSFYYSFTNLSMLKEPVWVGLDNYYDIFNFNRDFKMSLKTTLIYVGISVPLKLAFALFIAMLLNMKVKGIGFFKTVYYLPSILGGSVGIAILWRFLFSRTGFVNLMLGRIGIGAIDWLGSPRLALPTVSLLSVWQFGSSMILFLAALKQVPQDLYEAATVDGASRPGMFVRITIPMITPIVLFNIVMQMINAFQEFSAPFLITKGGPLKATYLYSMMVYENAFSFLKIRYASALSWISFLIIMLFSAAIFWFSKYWVFYQDGGDNG